MRAFLPVLLALVLLSVLPTSAETATAEGFSALPEEYAQMLATLPDAVRRSLPEDVFCSDPDEAAEALERLLDPTALLPYLLGLLLTDVSQPLSLLLCICGVLLLRAVIDALAGSVGGGLSAPYTLLCRLCFGLVLAQNALSLLESVVAYFTALRQLTEGYLPVMGALYLMGGNAATATVNHGTLLFSTALVDMLGGSSVLPVFSICFALTLIGMTDTGVRARLSHLSEKLKRWYTTAVSLTVLLLSAVLGAQTVLTAKADSLAFRTARFVVSSNIPLVGGSVAEMLRSAASGVGYLRSLVGVGGVIMLLALLLPTVGQVLVCRLVCSLGADMAAWLGCPDEGLLLRELASLYGYLLAVVSLCCMTFFFSLIVLVRCATAI